LKRKIETERRGVPPLRYIRINEDLIFSMLKDSGAIPDDEYLEFDDEDE
jgi:hypothetical protein